MQRQRLSCMACLGCFHLFHDGAHVADAALDPICCRAYFCWLTCLFACTQATKLARDMVSGAPRVPVHPWFGPRNFVINNTTNHLHGSNAWQESVFHGSTRACEFPIRLKDLTDRENAIQFFLFLSRAFDGRDGALVVGARRGK